MTGLDPALADRARRLGVDVSYRDVHDRRHDADLRALAAVVEMLAADAVGPGELVEPVIVAPMPAGRPAAGRSGAGCSVAVAAPISDAELRLADGTSLDVRVGAGRRHVHVDVPLPVGCHTLTVDTSSGRATTTIVRAPTSMRRNAAWHGGSGLFVPAYALWDHDAPLPSFGLLGRLARALGRLDTALLTTLPLYATFLDDPFDPSPYAPVSRLHWNEVFIDDVDLPAAPVEAQGRYLDWAGVAARRRAQLVSVVDDLDDRTRAELDRFVASRADVAAFARFMAGRDDAGRDDAGRDDAERGGDGNTNRVRRSHELAQYLAHRQLADVAAAGRGGDGAGLAIDLPIGCHVDGYERWAHPHLFAADATIGAPPDLFFADGQNWGLPPQLPAAGRRSGHRLWRDLLTRAGEHAALLRIDHVMAVHRLWWVPDGFGPDQGVYVRYPREELLAVIAATAAEVGTTVVGEDLGTVPAEVGEALARWDMLGMYEEQFHTDHDPLPAVPARTVAGIRTHDMAPFAAFVADQGPSLRPYRARLADQLGREVGDAYADVLDAVLERLAASASAMVTVDLDDLVGETEPHNVPGRVQDTTWRRRLDRPLSEVLDDPGVRRHLTTLGARPHA